MTTKTDFPFAETPAATMLANAIHQRQLEGTSLRKTAAELGYKQAVVLSHLLSGRVPIPVDRAPQLAKHLGMDEHAFMLAVLQQRYPDIAWVEHFSTPPAQQHSSFGKTLEAIVGADLNTLTDSQRRVIREVVADRNAEQRWLSVHEVPVVSRLRQAVPFFVRDGLADSDLDAIEALVTFETDTK